MSKTMLHLMVFALCLSPISVSAQGYRSESFTPELLKKAEAGDLNAQLHIAECYDKGIGVEQSKEKADFWFKKIQEQANKKAASINKTINEVNKVANKTAESMKKLVEDTKKLYADFKTKAEQGNPPSQLFVGLAHLDPNGAFVPYDKIEAYKWIKKASDGGDISGKYFLVKCIREGIGTPINTEKAALLTSEIDKSASPSQLTVLGSVLINGPAYLVEKEEGVKYLSKAAEKGDVNAQLLLGDYFYNTDPKQSAEWTKKASDQGNAAGQASLGMSLIMGRGVPEDKTQGIQLLKDSADQLNPEGMFGLGVSYINGNGIDKNPKKGARLIKSAADAGYPKAVDWIKKNPDKISLAEIRLEENKEQLEFYKDLKPKDEKAKKNRQQMISELLLQQDSLYQQLFREKNSH